MNLLERLIGKLTNKGWCVMDKKMLAKLRKEGLLSEKELALLHGEYEITKLSKTEMKTQFSKRKSRFSVKEASKKEFKEIESLLDRI